MPSSVDPSKCRRARKEREERGRVNAICEKSGRGTEEEEEERRGPSNLINEINLSAIFGGKVGKGKRGEKRSGEEENAKLQIAKRRFYSSSELWGI